MSRDIVAEIVRRALEPQAAVLGEAVAGESPIEERLRLLRESLEASRERLARQDLELARLREQVGGFASSVDDVRRRLHAVETQRWALRETPKPSVKPPLPTAASRPVAAAVPAPAIVRPSPVQHALAAAPAARATSWVPALTYAVFAAAALAAVAATRVKPARARLTIADVPPPMAGAIREPDAPVSTIADDLANADVLTLVYAYVPPGGTRSVRDILARQIESAPGSPWVFARVDAKTTLVSFRPQGDDAAVYEFAVDPASQVVSPSPDTLRALQGVTVASSR